MGNESKIIKAILNRLPAEKISDAKFEGANIVLYTKDKEYLFNSYKDIKSIVDEFKKRIELRPDPEICFDQEAAQKKIKSIIPEEAGVKEVLFDPPRSLVIIEAEKPGLAIGKQGSLLNEIKENTFWVPIIRREPPIKSKIIEGIRKVLFVESDYRKKFLDKVGHRVYDGWLRGRKEEWIRVSHLGGARQVGRSCLFLHTPESRILLDCGVDVTNDSEAYPHLEAPEFNINELDAVILTHSHLDHSGFIPYLFKFGYKGPIYCTEPTRDVASLLALDFVKIMRNEGKEPIYTQDDIKEMVKHTITLDYDEVTDITPDVRITLYNAGHILGSSMVHLHVGNGFHNIVYTGDLKFGPTKLLEAAETKFPRVESLIIESTYGGRNNNLPPKREADEALINSVKETIENGGKALVPVLGSGRAQEVMAIVDEAIKQGKLPDVTIYVDGIVWDITAIHSAYPEFLSRDLKRKIFSMDENPFLSKSINRVGSNKERKSVIEDEGPCIILATSGMLVGGPSVEYLKGLCENPKNSLIFVSYQGEGSLGRRIQGGEREVRFSSNGKNVETYQIKCRVDTIDGLSGHSDRRQLMSYLRNIKPRPKKAIIVHGESSRVLNLASSIHKTYRMETYAPRNLDVIRIK
jgi:hypothetical protein